MSKDTVLELTNPAKVIIEDTLTSFMREQAQAMLRVAIESEVNEFIAAHSNHKLANGHQRVVRNGYLPERAIQTGIGRVQVTVPRVRDRGDKQAPLHFQSNLIPQYMRCTATLDVLLPLLYLKGISTGDFPAVLAPVFGGDSKNLSANVISRLKSGWYDDYVAWQRRGLTHAPSLAVGDGALGFWGALSECFPSTQHQRCWVHKTANVLDKLPKSQRDKAKSHLQDIHMAATREDALHA